MWMTSSTAGEAAAETEELVSVVAMVLLASSASSAAATNTNSQTETSLLVPAIPALPGVHLAAVADDHQVSLLELAGDNFCCGAIRQTEHDAMRLRLPLCIENPDGTWTFA